MDQLHQYQKTSRNLSRMNNYNTSTNHQTERDFRGEPGYLPSPTINFNSFNTYNKQQQNHRQDHLEPSTQEPAVAAQPPTDRSSHLQSLNINSKMSSQIDMFPSRKNSRASRMSKPSSNQKQARRQASSRHCILDMFTSEIDHQLQPLLLKFLKFLTYATTVKIPVALMKTHEVLSKRNKAGMKKIKIWYYGIEKVLNRFLWEIGKKFEDLKYLVKCDESDLIVFDEFANNFIDGFDDKKYGPEEAHELFGDLLQLFGFAREEGRDGMSQKAGNQQKLAGCSLDGDGYDEGFLEHHQPPMGALNGVRKGKIRGKYERSRDGPQYSSSYKKIFRTAPRSERSTRSVQGKNRDNSRSQAAPGPMKRRYLSLERQVSMPLRYHERKLSCQNSNSTVK